MQIGKINPKRNRMECFFISGDLNGFHIILLFSDKYCQDRNYYQPDIYRLPALFLFFPDLSGGCYSSISHSVDEGTLLYLHIAYLL